MATGGDHRGASASQMPMVCAREVFHERPRNRSSSDVGREAPAAMAPSWADVPADILGNLLRLLPCIADRASVRSVCRHWRAAAAARVQGQSLPAPLPVVVLPRFKFSCLTSDGALTAARRAVMPAEVAGDGVRIVGSCDDWIVASIPSWYDFGKETGAECFLVHAFSGEVVRLPWLQESPCSYDWFDQSSSAGPVQRFCDVTEDEDEDQEQWVLLCNAALSASPKSGSKYIVAALCYHVAEPGLALWQPGMTSWYLCRSAGINPCTCSLAFCQGKLYVVKRYRSDIFAFEVMEDVHGVRLSCRERYTIDRPIIPSNPKSWRSCNMMVWRGKLLLIIRFFCDLMDEKMKCKPNSVEVFGLDFSTSPCGATRILHFDGDCVFVQKSGCRSFSAGLNAEIQGDFIYFLDEGIINNEHVSYVFVYNMRDGTARCFAAGRSEGSTFPIWIFPSS